MHFSEVIGQQPAKEFLRKLVDSGRIPHALMLLGFPGSGDLALALAFAQYVLCSNPSGGEACGTCSHCLKTSKLVHPDLHFSFPVVGANVTSDTYLNEWRKAVLENPWMDVNQWLQRIGAENKQGNINKEECLLVSKKLSFKTFEGRFKILVMWLPEYLGKEGNRLLKLFEEPPDDTLIILVAQNQELILNTILSRCQLVKASRLSDDEVAHGLMQLKNLSEENARHIARLAEGDFNEALRISVQPENDYSKLFHLWLRKCYLGNGAEMVAWVETFSALGRENQKHFLQYALHFLREFTLLKMANPGNVRLLPQELTIAQNLNKVLESGQIMRMEKLFSECAYHIERNANQKILFLDASIQLNKIIRAAG